MVCQHDIDLKIQTAQFHQFKDSGQYKVLGGGRCATCQLDGVTVYDPEQIDYADVVKYYLVNRGHSNKDFILAG